MTAALVAPDGQVSTPVPAGPCAMPGNLARSVAVWPDPAEYPPAEVICGQPRIANLEKPSTLLPAGVTRGVQTSQ